MSDMASGRITIRVPGALGERLRYRSRLEGQTESRLVRSALESFLDRSEKQPSAYQLAEEAELVGCIRRAAKDLSSNPRHLDGFGK